MDFILLHVVGIVILSFPVSMVINYLYQDFDETEIDARDY